jgi:hypothetical protein
MSTLSRGCEPAPSKAALKGEASRPELTLHTAHTRCLQLRRQAVATSPFPTRKTCCGCCRAGRASVVASLVVAGGWDRFAVRWRGRERLEHLRRSGTATAAAAAAASPPTASGSSSSTAAGLGPPHPQRPYPSLQAWVRRQAQGMSEGQRTFERAAQLRAAEIRRGVLFTYTELTWCARTYLTSAALGEEYWNDIELVRVYKSPLHAICVLSGRAGGRVTTIARRQEEDHRHVARGGSLLPWRLAGPSDAAPAPLLLSAAAPLPVPLPPQLLSAAAAEVPLPSEEARLHTHLSSAAAPLLPLPSEEARLHPHSHPSPSPSLSPSPMPEPEPSPSPERT